MLTVGIRIKTTNDTNGNPRRGIAHYVIEPETASGDAYELRARFLAFVEEGYSGERYALREATAVQGRDTVLLCSVDVAPAEYRAWTRQESGYTPADLAPFLKPWNAGLSSEPRGVAVALSRVLAGLRCLTQNHAEGRAWRMIGWFSMVLRREAEAEGWRLRNGRVLPPKP